MYLYCRLISSRFNLRRILISELLQDSRAKVGVKERSITDLQGMFFFWNVAHTAYRWSVLLDTVELFPCRRHQRGDVAALTQRVATAPTF